MVFSYLRSCYTTKAHMVANSDRESTLRWYFAPSGARVYPHRHNYSPLSWTGGSTAPNPIGEVVGSPRPWSNGVTPTCASGAIFLGEEEEYRTGVPALLPVPWIPNECGLPPDCVEFCAKNDPAGDGIPPVLTADEFPGEAMHDFSEVYWQIAHNIFPPPHQRGYILRTPSEACNGYNWRGQLSFFEVTSTTTTIVDCVLQSYDETTGTAVWLRPDTEALVTVVQPLSHV